LRRAVLWRKGAGDLSKPPRGIFGGNVNDDPQAIALSDAQRVDWLRLIRSQNVGPRGIVA
jgi:hypothetical protein